MPAHRLNPRNALSAGRVISRSRGNIRRMTRVKPAPPAEHDADRAVQDQLQRILASTTFQQVDRLKRFLTFIVSEAIDGRGHELKEYVIGVQVFGKEDAFDPRTDPIVRVQARRLRAKLVRYYREEGRSRRVDHRAAKGRLRAGRSSGAKRPCSSKRSISAALVSRNTIAVCRSPTTAPRRISTTSAAVCATRSSTASRDFADLADPARRDERPTRGAARGAR